MHTAFMAPTSVRGVKAQTDTAPHALKRHAHVRNDIISQNFVMTFRVASILLLVAGVASFANQAATCSSTVTSGGVHGVEDETTTTGTTGTTGEEVGAAAGAAARESYHVKIDASKPVADPPAPGGACVGIDWWGGRCKLDPGFNSPGFESARFQKFNLMKIHLLST